jgi:hypothetical protein
MKTLNRTKDFGRIAPPWMGNGFDRPAYFQQGEDFFDAHDRQIIPGQPIVVEADEPDDEGSEDSEQISAGELVALAETMSWPKWAAAVKKVLGPDSPRGKAAMLAALQEALQKHGERQSKRTTKKTEADAPAKPNSKSGIDLAAWARGQKHYLAGEVFKALRNEYHVQLSERRDAVDFLIAQGVIEASQARTDV